MYKVFVLSLIIFMAKSAMASEFLSPKDIMDIPFSQSTYRLSYGANTNQFGDLRIPEGDGPYPVLVVIHGGCWTSKIASVDFMSAFSEAFTKLGVATWNIEYRCVDNEGGGWPGTFLDVGQAVDYLRNLAPKYNLDLQNVIVVGHSAGGHLALWSGARHKISDKSELYESNTLPLKAVINIAGPGDLNLFLDIQEEACGSKVINKLLGSSKTIVEKRLPHASPYELLPFGTKQVLITGEYDKAAPVGSMENYYKKAIRLGDDVELIVIENAGHFEVVDHRTTAWDIIKNRVLHLFFN